MCRRCNDKKGISDTDLRSGFVSNVRFAPNATEVLHCREMALSAASYREQKQHCAPVSTTKKNWAKGDRR